MTDYIFKDETETKIPIGKIVCLARSYKKHAHEMQSEIPKEPVIFLKPASSIIFNGDTIKIPKMSKSVHHEVELGIVIGKKCKKILKNEAMNHVLGYLVALDITARDIQSEMKNKGWPWTIAKSFDTFAPISEVVLKKNVTNPQNLDISLKVNNECRQSSNTSFMIFSIEEIIEYISNVMTLEPGDLILTGTPEGVGEIKRGDILEAKLGNVCSLKVNVD